MFSAVFLLFVPAVTLAADLKLDETPARDAEWGYRPAQDAVCGVNPPSFSWRPQKSIVSWQIECRRDSDTDAATSGPIAYSAEPIGFHVHCPPKPFAPGRYVWRYRGVNGDGQATNWSESRTFEISQDAATMPMPPREELLARIPSTHPRLFIRPEDLPRLRELAAGEMNDRFEALKAKCERLVKNPPPTAEPPKYPADVAQKSEEWRVIWWGNRTYTIAALDSAATLAFTRLLGGKEEYGQLAKRILLDCARWDPKGATGYRYNDEAGMPYAYYFSRTYTFLGDSLSEAEKQTCRRVMKIRGEEMYNHLCPRHLWEPYSSHSNRAWHFLGEVGIAFHGEIEGADDWVDFAMNVFYNTYPVWSDDDGGWHEGASYWSSYIGRFTWWADVMRSAMRIDAFDKPYFSKIGYYPIYLMPPGKVGGGFGDLNAKRRASDNVSLMSELAAQGGNGHWQWYVEQLGGPSESAGYIGFVRGTLPKVEPQSPSDLPASRLFRGTGQAALNTTLLDADEDVQILFKSSPFGTQSHGYESNNAFLLWAYGRRLLIRSGYRDIYGSDHHRNWMWTTRSVNDITVDGQGQTGHSASAQGRITAFSTSPSVDIVIGEAGDAYRVDDRPLDRFSRAIVFIKPELIVVYDRLDAGKESSFEYWLHATDRLKVDDQHNIHLQVDDVACEVNFLAPEGLSFTQTDQYDPNPRPRITLREWHLTAKTPKKAKRIEFVTLYRPHRIAEDAPRGATLKETDDGYMLNADLEDGGTVEVHLPKQTDAIEVRRMPSGIAPQ